MKVTIKDIANLAGVAKSTVSRYLNGGHVSPETAEKLKRIIDEYNYEPNAFAQSLKAKRTNLVGVIAPCLDSYMTSRLLMSLDEELKQYNITTMIMSMNQHAERETDSLLKFARQKVDAIILITKQMTKEHDEIISSINIPVLVIGQEANICNCIVYDDYQAGYDMGKYVASQGHRHIAYLGVEENDISVGIRRKAGVLHALEEAGILDVPVIQTSFTLEAGEAEAERLIRTMNPSVIVCATDTLALGAWKAIMKSGRQFPNDISLSGFGGYGVSSAIYPSLATIKFEVEETGVLAARTVMQMIQGEYVTQMQRTGHQLIKGESVCEIES